MEDILWNWLVDCRSEGSMDDDNIAYVLESKNVCEGVLKEFTEENYANLRCVLIRMLRELKEKMPENS